MVRIENVEVYGLDESIKASGYPMKVDFPETLISDNYESDYKRARNLGSTKIGHGHDNFLNGIIVQFDLTIPVKVWTELQRYHFIDFVSSASTMHRIKSMDFSSVYDESVDPRVIEIMKELQNNYNNNPTDENFLRLVMTNPNGMTLTARMTTNYRQLKTIHLQRKNHRLPHWRYICKWIETLPQMKDFIVSE